MKIGNVFCAFSQADLQNVPGLHLHLPHHSNHHFHRPLCHLLQVSWTSLFFHQGASSRGPEEQYWALNFKSYPRFQNVVFPRKQQMMVKKSKMREEFGNVPPPGYNPNQPVFTTNTAGSPLNSPIFQDDMVKPPVVPMPSSSYTGTTWRDKTSGMKISLIITDFFHLS